MLVNVISGNEQVPYVSKNLPADGKMNWNTSKNKMSLKGLVKLPYKYDYLYFIHLQAT